MVVSGSVYSLMEKLFKDRKEPLYGRQDSTIKLQAFPTSILKQIMEDNAPGYSNDDLLALYTFTGGIPKYVELFIDVKATTCGKMIAKWGIIPKLPLKTTWVERVLVGNC